MATIINNPPSTSSNTNENSSYTGVIVAVLLIVFLFLVFYFGLPVLRRATTPAQINVPDKVDVNVNTPNY